MSGTKNLRLSICIATNTYREAELKRLMAVLEPQLTPEVEVLIFFNNFEYSLGYLRQCLLQEAGGEYICHIDDDDMIPDDYVATILPLLDGVDYIGFKVEFTDNGREMKPVYHSLKYTHWYDDEDGYYRGVTHLNPLRTELARTVDFPVERLTGEDEKWSNQIKAKTEHFIDRPMYYYWHLADNSVAYTLAGQEVTDAVGSHAYITRPHDTPHRTKFKSKQIRYHPNSTKDVA